MILCNPHNPIDRIWDCETLERIGELCWKHHVTVVSDEIHCDLTDPGFDYVPFASVGEHCAMNSVTCMAPTKNVQHRRTEFRGRDDSESGVAS